MDNEERKKRLAIVGEEILTLLEEFPEGIKGGTVMDIYIERKIPDYGLLEHFTMQYIWQALERADYIRINSEGFIFRTIKPLP